MKTTALLLCLSLSACTSYDDLVKEAEATGNWEPVTLYEERKERRAAERAAKQEIIKQCKDRGLVYTCTSSGIRGLEECRCMSEEQLKGNLGWNL